MNSKLRTAACKDALAAADAFLSQGVSPILPEIEAEVGWKYMRRHLDRIEPTLTLWQERDLCILWHLTYWNKVQELTRKDEESTS